MTFERGELDGQERLRVEEQRANIPKPYSYPTEGFQVIQRYHTNIGGEVVSLTQANDYAAKQRLYIVTYYRGGGDAPKVFVSNKRTDADIAYETYKEMIA